MPGELRSADLLVLLVYLIGVFGMGCWFARKQKTSRDFMAAGGNLAGWTVGLSIFGTYVSSIGFLGNTGKAFGADWSSWVFGLSLPIGAWIAVRAFVPMYRANGDISAYAHLERRFGPWARMLAVAFYLLLQLGRIGVILYLVALALAPLTGWDLRTIIVVMGVMVTIYTLLGGIEAVIWTDVVQSVVLTLGAALCLGVLLMRMPEGPGQVWEIAQAADKFDLGGFRLVLHEPSFWLVLVYGIFINLQNFGVDQGFVQRYATARSEAAAKRSVWLGAWLFLPASTLFFLIGTSLYAFYQAQPDLLPADVAAEPDRVYPYFMVTQLPDGVTGVLIAAIFAAAMSSVDTSLNSSATLVHSDFFKRLRPDMSERQSMRVLRGATLGWGLVGTAAAMAIIGQKSALDAWWNLQGIFGGGLLGLFLLGLIVKKAGNPVAMVSVGLGTAVIAYLALSGQTALHKHFTIILGTSTMVIVGFLLSAWRRA